MPLAVVTGASRGLGRALAAGLAAAGWKLIIDARGAEALAETRDALGPTVTAIPGDVTDPAHRDALVEAAGERGGVDLLINNAGILGPSPQPPLADYPLDVLRDVYEVNVVAPLALIQLLLPTLRTRNGAVVNITSDAAVEAYPGWGGYGSAKAALEQASRVLAAEESAVRVWWVDPGDLRTRMHQEAFPGEDISDRTDPESVVPAFLSLLSARPPSGRLRAADISELTMAEPSSDELATSGTAGP
jgi:NAD(P)-dependent dehydrogenase (short-subunit alcohol dehydrogenase family)